MRPRLAGIAVAFFGSGAAALVYQVTWQRILALHSGVGIYSIAMIVGAFMVGLGLGSHWGGAWSERITPGRSLLVFAALEVAIAAFGASSTWVPRNTRSRARDINHDLFPRDEFNAP